MHSHNVIPNIENTIATSRETLPDTESVLEPKALASLAHHNALGIPPLTQIQHLPVNASSFTFQSQPSDPLGGLQPCRRR